MRNIMFNIVKLHFDSVLYAHYIFGNRKYHVQKIMLHSITKA